MKEITCFIVEDASDVVNDMTNTLHQNFPHINVVGSADNAKDSIAKIKSLMPDLILLDIELNGRKTGFDVLEELRELGIKEYSVIFITSFRDYNYAKKAIRYTNLEYIEKPIIDEVFIRTVTEAINDIESRNQENQMQYLMHLVQNQGLQSVDKIAISLPDKQTRLVNFNDIVYFETDLQNWSKWYLVEGRPISSNRAVKDYFSRYDLANLGFVRIHQSYVVNWKHVIKTDSKESTLWVTGDIELSVSGANRTTVFNTSRLEKKSWIKRFFK